MDLASLTVVLRAALSHNPDERKAAQASLDQSTWITLLLMSFLDRRRSWMMHVEEVSVRRFHSHLQQLSSHSPPHAALVHPLAPWSLPGEGDEFHLPEGRQRELGFTFSFQVSE